MLHFAKRELETLLCVIFTFHPPFSQLFMDVQVSIVSRMELCLGSNLPEVCLHDSFLCLFSRFHTIVTITKSGKTL